MSFTRFFDCEPPDSQQLLIVLDPFAIATRATSSKWTSVSQESESGYRLSKLSSVSAKVPWMAVNALKDMRATFHQVFSQLRALHTSFIFHDLDHFPDRAAEMHRGLRKRNRLLKSILLAAPNLTCLGIEFREHLMPPIVLGGSETLHNHLKLSCVENVSLTGLSFLEKDILNFLKNTTTP